MIPQLSVDKIVMSGNRKKKSQVLFYCYILSKIFIIFITYLSGYNLKI